MKDLPNLPFLHQDDAYLIALEQRHDGHIDLTGVFMTPGNGPAKDYSMEFTHADKLLREKIIHIINIRYPGKLVYIRT